jgi:hypothetical protein
MLLGLWGPEDSIDPKETSSARQLLIFKFPGALRKRANQAVHLSFSIFHFPSAILGTSGLAMVK